MDIQQLLQWGTEYFSEYVFVFISTLIKPTVRFHPIEGQAEDSILFVSDKTRSLNIGSKLNPKLFSFTIISIFLGLTLNSIISTRLSILDVFSTSLVVLVVWFAYSCLIYALCKMFGGKGSLWETISVSLQLLAVIYVVSNLIALVWRILVQVPLIFGYLIGRNQVLDLFIGDPIFFYYFVDFILMLVYLPAGLKYVHRFRAISLAITTILPLTVIVLCGTFMSLSTGINLCAETCIQTSTAPVVATASTRWQVRSPIPTARRNFAIAVSEGLIYVIGGETDQGVTGSVECYDPASDTWATLKSKPIPVANVGAAVIGGKIYVPGGRLISQAITNALEVYDPVTDQWEQRANLPISLNAYALAAFDGKLFLFGGSNGKEYLASAYEYDAVKDLWIKLTSMPTARGYASAAVAGGKIYVIGGTSGTRALSVNEEYTPERDKEGETPWQLRAPLPDGRFEMGIASLADIIHVVGGEKDSQPLLPLEYFPQKDEWQPFESPLTVQTWSGLGLVALGADLHAMGGIRNGTLTTQHLSYQAIYLIAIPVVK